VDSLAVRSQFGRARMALCGSRKAAIVLLAKAWAAEYGPVGVRANAVSPCPTSTDDAAKVYGAVLPVDGGRIAV
jgi:NAD(P)-dependent dehydrogenase (short-subunit alcohol dehydrogenase family)